MVEMLNEILKKAQNGDKKAFDILYKRFEVYLFKISEPFVSLIFNRDDILQEASIAFIKAVNTYKLDSKVNFSVYLKKLVKNHLINYVNQYRKNLEFQLRILEDHLNQSYIDKNSEFTEEEILEKILKVLKEKLTPLEKKVFHLYTLKNSYKSIAAALNISEKSVDNAIYRFKSKISENLTEEEIHFISENSRLIMKILDEITKFQK